MCGGEMVMHDKKIIPNESLLLDVWKKGGLGIQQ